VLQCLLAQSWVLLVLSGPAEADAELGVRVLQPLLGAFVEEILEVNAHAHLPVDILHVVLLGGVPEQNFFARPLTLRLGDAPLLEDLLHDMALAFDVSLLHFGHLGFHFHGEAACAAHQFHPTDTFRVILGNSAGHECLRDAP